MAKIPVKMYLFNRKCVGWCRSASSHPVTYSHMLKSELLLQYIMRHRLTLPLKCIQFDNLNYCCQHQTALNNYSWNHNWIWIEPIFLFFCFIVFAQMHAHDLLNLYQVLHTHYLSDMHFLYCCYLFIQWWTYLKQALWSHFS